MNEKKTIIVYTDGSCFNNGKKCATGGIGIHFPNGELDDLSLPLDNPPITNQRAELSAIHTALKYIRRELGLVDKHVIIKTDSLYSINCLTKWVKGWIKNHWKTSKGEPVLNQDYIKIIYVYLQKYDIEFVHVDAHTGGDDYDSIHNAIADELAVAGTKSNKKCFDPNLNLNTKPKNKDFIINNRTSIHKNTPIRVKLIKNNE